ncbi:type VII secretion integral membrane protein EccD [Stackebrandtia nassauensis]|uniref:Secretion protein snm4 n=1 Tax=Stackebrandtia nassauensis (strain DSM 44728 / CIP 108903 / NRRL B-16338 / NBRC 102104 / LLR-40K-21) TaxID=446470 RepID=D3Q707_STANL|nr:type VII secretion integral membrane protein EccD [Stackebrandtia nassauensis]ADD40406.1 secretion protein snm4 [Stackebrandtia nassauensis DSM 44728]
MTTAIRTGLTRITVSAPRRRIDLVLPDHLPVSELLPIILDYAGEGAADDAEKHGGFDLRRTDGKTINPAQSMAMQQIRDGELLHLAPRHADWPEGEYDDVVEAIAAGAKVLGKQWDGNHTRITGLTIAVIAGVLALAGLWLSGPKEVDLGSWLPAGITALSAAVVLMAIGIALARASGDSVAGATLGGLSLLFAAFGGYVILAFRYPLEFLGSEHLLVASAIVLSFSIVGFYAIGESLRVFTAGVVVGFFGIVAAALGFGPWNPDGDAAATVSITIMLLPSIPVLSMRFAKLPMPQLPQSAKELVKDSPNPPKEEIFAKVLRADELLTGLLIGVSVVTALCLWVVDTTPTLTAPVSQKILLGVIGCVYLLRARLFPAVRQRVPLLAAGIIGLALLADDAVGLFGPDLQLVGLGVIVLPAVLIAVASGLVYSKKAPSPYIGRIADILDILLIVAVVPVACAAMGLFGFFRGLTG